MLHSHPVLAQEETTVLDTAVGRSYKMVIAGDYDRTGIHNFFFGRHYRKEWGTAVKARVMMLDTSNGGLTPYEAGGGRQSKTLKLRDRNKREYALRSLDKSFGRALPEKFRGTFIEDAVDDQVTIGHPYSAFTIPTLADAAKIYHTNPGMGYIPKQPALDSFSEDFGNRLYLLEQRPDENWETAPNFGNSKNIVSTEKLIEKLLKNNENRVDQQLYVRSRLFDMFIGDWGRHEDQWRWASFESDNGTLYQPIPRDRDQAYTKFDGLLVRALLHAANQDNLQNFKGIIRDVKAYNFTTRHLDRLCANETTLEQWRSIADDLKASLTDDVIEKAIRKMPPEVFPISGDFIISSLKSRRDHLTDYADQYYRFLARHVDVPGSSERELFEVTRQGKDATSVKVYAIDKQGNRSGEPYYSRLFKSDETQDIRLYGIAGNDVYQVSGTADDAILVRIIGGPDRDSIIDRSDVSGGKHTEIYDDRNNVFDVNREAKLKLGNDSAVHAYNYNEFEYSHTGIKLSAFYNNPDRFYVSAGYGFARHEWRNYPYGFQQALYLRYSISQNALALLYEGTFYQFIGKWDLGISANYDWVRWTNFYGLGNETKNNNTTANYYQLRTNEFNGGLSLSRIIRNKHHIEVSGFYQAIEVIDDSGRFVTDNYTAPQLYFFEHHLYAGGRVGYTFQDVNDPIVPTKGLMFYAGAAYTQNIQETSKAFASYNGILQLYFPLFSKFSFSVRGGLGSVSGDPEFYQYQSIGGGINLRGFRRDRFWGKTAFYNQNELRYITDFKGYLMNGKFGLLAFADEGRVWMPNETSDKIHVGYGGGIMLAPFNLASISFTYGVSDEARLFQIRLNRLLF
jgi:hypothetical protein